MQYDRLTLAVFEKGLRDRNSPIGTLSQNGYGDQNAKARKYTCLLPFNKIAALHVHGAREEVSWLREEQESVGRQGCNMQQCHARYGRQRPRCVQV
jgi:hypothetical protein